MECLIQALLYVSSLISASTATHQVFYVLPDNSTNVSCSFQPCATLNQYLLDNNGSLPVVSNVEYHFLPGGHHMHVPTNVTLRYLHNFMIVGSYNKLSPSVLFIYLKAYVRIRNLINFTISNMVIEASYIDYEFSSFFKCNMILSNCFSCKMTNVTFLNYGFFVRI